MRRNVINGTASDVLAIVRTQLQRRVSKAAWHNHVDRRHSNYCDKNTGMDTFAQKMPELKLRDNPTGKYWLRHRTCRQQFQTLVEDISVSADDTQH